MDNLIKQLTGRKAVNKALSSSEVLKLTENKANLITYPQLAKMSSIKQALGKYGACIILYETKRNYGHWCCIIKQSPKLIEFFDSYGMMPDDQLQFVSPEFRKENDEDYSHLTYLLWKSKCTVEYNHTKLQEKIHDVNTCGRWCGLRILLRDMPMKKFVKIFKRAKCPDGLVTFLTSLVL